MPLTKNQLITLKIDALSSDGNGLGRHEGQVVFLPDAAPGDLAEVKIVKVAKTHAFARMETLLEAGPGRQESDCPVSKTCGGCCFRHLQYKEELAAKQGFVQDALQRLAKLDIPVLPILPSPQENRYRNKVQYPVAAGPGGQLSYGFFAKRSHRPVPCRDCLLQPESLNDIAAGTAEALAEAGISAYDEQTHTGLLRHICLRQSSQTGQVQLTLVINAAALPNQKELAAVLARRFPQLSGVLVCPNTRQTNVIFGPHFQLLQGQALLQDEIAGVPQSLSPAAFSQVNPAAAELLFAQAAAFAAVQPHETLLDLYCGAGVIGLSMAKSCKQLVGVELQAEAVESAKASAAQMGLANTRFLCEDAALAAAKLAEEGLRPDVALLDPPRKGCGEAALRPLLQMAPARVVMVSCNPATLARDLAFLCENGYRAVKAQPVDLFPRTRHVETVCLLERQKP